MCLWQSVTVIRNRMSYIPYGFTCPYRDPWSTNKLLWWLVTRDLQKDMIRILYVIIVNYVIIVKLWNHRKLFIIINFWYESWYDKRKTCINTTLRIFFGFLGNSRASRLNFVIRLSLPKWSDFYNILKHRNIIETSS